MKKRLLKAFAVVLAMVVMCFAVTATASAEQEYQYTITADTTIYFKVRAYKKVDGQTIYSDWSAVKSVKIK